MNFDPTDWRLATCNIYSKDNGHSDFLGFAMANHIFPSKLTHKPPTTLSSSKTTELKQFLIPRFLGNHKLVFLSTSLEKMATLTMAVSLLALAPVTLYINVRNYWCHVSLSLQTVNSIKVIAVSNFAYSYIPEFCAVINLQ